MDTYGNRDKPLSDYQIKLSELRRAIEKGDISGDSRRSVKDIIASGKKSKR